MNMHENKMDILHSLVNGPRHWSTIVGFRSTAYEELRVAGIITKQTSTGRIRLTPSGRELMKTLS